MTHLTAFTAIIIWSGLVAKVFPKAMAWVFDRFPKHFKPQESTSRVVEDVTKSY